MSVAVEAKIGDLVLMRLLVAQRRGTRQEAVIVVIDAVPRLSS
jgi:hypothetical protein